MITKQIVMSFDEEFQNWFISEGSYPTNLPFTPAEVDQAIEQLKMYVKSKHQNYLIGKFIFNESNAALENELANQSSEIEDGPQLEENANS